MADVLKLHGAWVALHVRANHERAVAKQLDVHGYEPFLPMSSSEPRPGRPAGRPLFPGYVFCRYQPCPTVRMVQIPGVVRLLSYGNGPAVLSEGEIEAVRRVSSSGAGVEPWAFLQRGQRVRITCGPLRGLEGILADSASRLRMIVSVTMLRRSVAVSVDAGQLAVLPHVA